MKFGFLFLWLGFFWTNGVSALEHHEMTLSNGLRVYFFQNKMAPIVYHSLWYGVGSADEEPGKSGLAHIHEHLAFKETSNRKIGYSNIITSWGGIDNATTSEDRTNYYAVVPKERLGDVMALEADRMFNLVLTDEVVSRESKAVLEERNMRTDSSPENVFFEQFMSLLYSNHRYGIPIIGWKHEIEQYTTQTVTDFYRRWYSPKNAFLVIVGDLEFSEVASLVEAHYGKLQNHPQLAKRNRTQEPPRKGTRYFTFPSEELQQGKLLKMCRMAPGPVDLARHSARRLVELEVFAPRSGALYKTLVLEKQLAIDVSGGVWDLMDYSNWYYDIQLAKGSEATQVLATIKEVAAKYAKSGVTPERLEALKKKMSYSNRIVTDGYMKLGSYVGELLSLGFTMEQVNQLPESLKSVTADDFLKAAKEMARDEACVTGEIVPVVTPEPTNLLK